eukprot:CAMPEP_0172464318 /NCGR_PEP_ID=MMETSP1065-20121228/50080_1 /TAXON_ID=265537 /ORGANISM="Amphiprora paludosa, Strain CCMP125" /LENGTH=52 /DNA_ID=CAMNT_0013220511 /DNA_START=62 /DNA_END=216 /DNA_ORIENTATION=-
MARKMQAYKERRTSATCFPHEEVWTTTSPSLSVNTLRSHYRHGPPLVTPRLA